MVTETFDSGLLGEHVITTLSDAWNRLIATDTEVCLSVCLSVCLLGEHVISTLMPGTALLLQTLRSVCLCVCLST